jgi:hypothetical protein
LNPMDQLAQDLNHIKEMKLVETYLSMWKRHLGLQR